MRARFFLITCCCVLCVLAGCKTRQDEPPPSESAPLAPTFLPLDDARVAALRAKSEEVVGLLFAGKCEEAAKTVHVPFGYGRRDRRMKRAVPSLDLLSARELGEVCATLSQKTPPSLRFERASHLAKGHWEVPPMKALMPAGADHLSFALDDKASEGLDLYFDQEGRCLGLIEEVRP